MMKATCFNRRLIRPRAWWLPVAAGLTAVLVACGGGGGGSSSTATPAAAATATTFSGPITGFGSVFVNGVRIDDNSATITLDDDNGGGRDADLKLGMVVDIQGEHDNGAQTGRATSISSHSFVQGPISAINVAGNQLTVLGVAVTVVPGTAFGGTNVTSLASLGLNDTVEIHGLPDATGSKVTATRIERIPSTNEVRLIGTAQSATTGQFVLNGMAVQYTAASLVNLPNGVTNGMTVRVKGNLSGASTIVASRIRQVSLVPALAEGQRLEVKGVISTFNSASSFSISTLRVTVPSTATVSGTPAPGTRVEVKGTVVQGVLVATQVEVENENEPAEAHEFHSVIASIDKSQQTLTLRDGSVVVKWDGSTVFDTATLPRGADDLVAGLKVEVKGRLTGSAVLATRIKRDN
ncbi:conserved hypothetical protein [Paraburkholderia caribensis]|nr:conserved hypothetical protein [Paraburkholderia caribensis]